MTLLRAATVAAGLLAAAPLAAQDNAPLIHARVTGARAVAHVHAHTLPRATVTAVAAARPLAPADVQRLTRAASLSTPVTLGVDHRASALASLELLQAEDIPSNPGTWALFDKTGGTFDNHGPVVTVQAQAGKKYLLDFVINWYAPVSMKVTLPDGEQTASFDNLGTHHVTVLVDAAASAPYPVLLQSTNREWLFISCTVTPLQ